METNEKAFGDINDRYRAWIVFLFQNIIITVVIGAVTIFLFLYYVKWGRKKEIRGMYINFINLQFRVLVFHLNVYGVGARSPQTAECLCVYKMYYN